MLNDLLDLKDKGLRLELVSESLPTTRLEVVLRNDVDLLDAVRALRFPKEREVGRQICGLGVRARRAGGSATQREDENSVPVRIGEEFVGKAQFTDSHFPVIRAGGFEYADDPSSLVGVREVRAILVIPDHAAVGMSLPPGSKCDRALFEGAVCH